MKLVLKSTAQKKISIIWFINAGIMATIFIVFTIGKKFDGNDTEGWSWFTQNIIPILTLMIATFTHNINNPNSDGKLVDRFYFRLVKNLSIFYFFVLYITILSAPLALKYSNIPILELLEKSKIYLSIFQGVVAYSLGLFFLKESKENNEAPNPNP
ncbi:hypothetical protein EMN47_12355 [Prolixibacteraceae bacterium JC049]|nr:hypothetical protein [Prolixibacteraceae bacterium JC049]